jgi:hypothetical protein
MAARKSSLPFPYTLCLAHNNKTNRTVLPSTRNVLSLYRYLTGLKIFRHAKLVVFLKKFTSEWPKGIPNAHKVHKLLAFN